MLDARLPWLLAVISLLAVASAGAATLVLSEAPADDLVAADRPSALDPAGDLVDGEGPSLSLAVTELPNGSSSVRCEAPALRVPLYWDSDSKPSPGRMIMGKLVQLGSGSIVVEGDRRILDLEFSIVPEDGGSHGGSLLVRATAELPQEKSPRSAIVLFLEVGSAQMERGAGAESSVVAMPALLAE